MTWCSSESDLVRDKANEDCDPDINKNPSAQKNTVDNNINKYY